MVTWLISGISLLGPLRLADLGLGGGQIGACFATAAVFGLLIRPTMGRWADRNGTAGTIRSGLLGSAMILMIIAWPNNRWLVAVLMVLGLMSTSVYIPSTMIFLADACAAVRAGQVSAAIAVGLCWPPGGRVGVSWRRRTGKRRRSASDLRRNGDHGSPRSLVHGTLQSARDGEHSRKRSRIV